MTDQQYADTVARVREKLRKWRVVLGLEEWDITTTYDREVISEHPQATGTADVQWEYMRGVLHFNMWKMSGYSDEEIDEVVVHELLHFVVNEMRDYWDDDGKAHIKHEERVVQNLTLAFLRMGRKEDEVGSETERVQS